MTVRRTALEWLATSLVSEADSAQNRAFLRDYLHHFDQPAADMDTAADHAEKIERIARFFELLAGAAAARANP
jgi:hypothetical protein